jgi:long-chain acyl-CoA synthetase
MHLINQEPNLRGVDKMIERPWQHHYDEGVPFTLKPYPNKSLLDVAMETARERPDHPALLFKGATLTYGRLEELSNAFASALVASGLKKGDRVTLLLPNTPQLVIALFGVWKAGGIAVPTNPLYTEREIEYALNECGAQTALVMTRFYNKVKAIQPNTQVGKIIATNIKEYLPPATRILFTLLKEKKEGDRITLQPGDLWLEDLLHQHAGSPRPEVPISPEDSAIMLFSGGTTGTPKAAIGSHQALLITGMQLHAWFGNILVDWVDPIMLNMPMFHVYGLGGALTAGLVCRAPLVVVPNPRDLDDMLATIEKTKPAFLPGVPTLFNALCNHPKVVSGKVSLKSIKLSISGAAPLLEETKLRFERVTGGRIVEGIALTETMMGAVVTPTKGLYKPGAVGIPLPDIDVRIVDAEIAGDALPPGQMGEIIIQAPQLMKGYWEKPTETANTIRDGWLYTGDLGYLDEDGYLFIVDRKKDVIKPSGFQVWPREVEEIIATHPAVLEVGVAGVQDAQQGEAVKAWVVLRPGQTVSAEELRIYCREKLAAYKVPKYVEFRNSLPKTTVGKILRRELAASDESTTGKAN